MTQNLKSGNVSNWMEIQNNLTDQFESFVKDLSTKIDPYFKTFNKNLKENIEIQVKASKKEKSKYLQFLNNEEKLYWKEFPRKRNFYHVNLRKIHTLMKDSKGLAPQRDLSLIISTVLNVMPLASKRYCKVMEIEPIFHQDQDNKTTFNTMIDEIKNFDPDEMSNWRLLGLITSQMVADIIYLLLDQVQLDKDIQISQGNIIYILLDICKHYAPIQTFRNELVEEDSIYDLYFKQVQVSWAKIYGRLSIFSFEKCLKFMMTALVQDFKKMKEDEIELAAQRIYFCRFLSVIPSDKLQASNIQILFDNLFNTLTSKYVTQEMKNVLLITLKYLVEQFDFSDQSFDFDSAMGILWPNIENMFKVSEKCMKKEFLKDYALQLHLMIIKISPQQFFNEAITKLLKKEKIQSYFETKKSYNVGMQLMMELCQGLPFITNKHQDWAPKIHERSFYIIDNHDLNILTPQKVFVRTTNFKLSRKITSTDSLPFNFSESFKSIFNPKLLQEINQQHQTYLRQVAFEDIDFLISQILPQLLIGIKTQEKLDLPILAFKTIDFILNPIHSFKEQFLKLWPHQQKYFNDQKNRLTSYTSIIVKEILRSQILKSEFLTDVNNFFKSDDRELCNDQLSVIWPKQCQGLYLYGKNISQLAKTKGVGKFHLQEERRVISFEDFRELQKTSQNEDASDIQYQNEGLNQVTQSVDREIKEWDFKKEKFLRHRLTCFITEERKEGSRQNTTQFSLPQTKNQELRLTRKIIKMMHYLPEVQDYFKVYPSRRLMVEDNALLTNRVPEINFSDYDDSVKQDYMTQGNFEDIRLGLAQQPMKKKKSDPKFVQKQLNPKLRELQSLLPYYLMSLDFDLSIKTSKQIQKLMVFGDLKMRLALVDQVVYFIKELMLESPEDYLIGQYLQLLVTLIKIWHHSERNKIQVSSIQMREGHVLSIAIINLSIRDFNDDKDLNSSSDLMVSMTNYQYIFELIDMISLLGISNKDKFIRHLSTLLIVESGKMKRLLVKKDQYKNSLYDIIEKEKSKLNERVLNILLIVYPIKQQEIQSKEQLHSIIKHLTMLEIFSDNVDYKKINLSETVFKDIQLIYLGELISLWKNTLIQSSENSVAILNFINTLAQRTLHLFENKQDQSNLLTKDYVGINLLHGITYYNATHSAINLKKTESDQTDSSNPSNNILSTNSIFEELSGLIFLLDLDFSDIYKSAYGKFYPQRFSVSQIVISFLYQLQEPLETHSLENLKDIFKLDMGSNSKPNYFKNCLIFYAILTLDSNSKILQYYIKDKRNLAFFIDKIAFYDIDLDSLNLEDIKHTQSLILYLTYVHSILKGISSTFSKQDYNQINNYLSGIQQFDILQKTKSLYEVCQNSNLEWLTEKIKEIWQVILSFETIFNEVPNIKLDLRFLIQLEQSGYQVLKYYKYLHNNNVPLTKAQIQEANLQEEAQQDFTVNELKFLMNHIYTFYQTQGNLQEMLLKKNPYYRCFIKNIVGADQLLAYLKSKNFNQVYGQLTSSCLRSTKALIETKIKKFISYSLHSKYFLLGLFMSLNSMDKKTIERSKILCLSVLPLMFEDDKFREMIESSIAEHEDIRSLVAFDNKNFYRFVKQAFKDEENFNMKNHFEKYFSVSGLLRNTLNEVIKLQTLKFSHPMLLKILDIITYFIGNLQLRRAPQVDQNSFIFDNLIDYKSFEFLSKLYKISEKLVDYDDETVIMNMWYKVIEGKISNFEILAKFLVHNLSTYLLKLRDKNQQAKDNQQIQLSKKKNTSEYSLEFEKQKRYALSIFNYIKARTAQMDIRNSINVTANSITWSQKMIRLLTRTSLNIHSKYVLEKLKLKKILQIIHQEVNETSVKLQLKGGLNQQFEVLNNKNQRMSINMSQLLQSQTFLETFAARNRKQKCIMKNLMFRIRKIMLEKFEESAPQQQVESMSLLVIKYFENSLVFITNDVERPTQVIKFSQKEEISVVIVMIILTVDLIVSEPSENRFYFLLETFNKLSINIGSVQKYFNFKMFTTSQIYSKDVKIIDKITSIINMKPGMECFKIFTKVYFKMLQNLYCCTQLNFYLIKLWHLTLTKQREILSSQQSPVQTSVAEFTVNPITYTRQITLTMLQTTFFSLYEISQSRRDSTPQELKNSILNFKHLFGSLIELVLPQNQTRPQQISGMHNSESTHVAFANNAIFWLSYICLETAGIIDQYDQSVASELLIIGTSSIRRVLEESDFLKMLIGISKLSQHFYSYSLSIFRKQSSFLNLLFDAIENPKCLQDAVKCLIITVRIQDYKLLMNLANKDLLEVELQRFLILIPFMQQQFSFILKDNGQQNPNQIFTNHRSIVQLLKKSLPSIGIDKKKDIFERLDTIQREAQKNEEKPVVKEFEGLIQATITLCHQIQQDQVIFDCERIFMEIKSTQNSNGFIEISKVDLAIKIINEFIVDNELIQPSGQLTFKQNQTKNLIQNVYIGDLLGEEVTSIRESMRPLYFGLKNIILREIENIDKDIDIQKFFFEDSSGSGLQDQPNYSSSITPIMESQEKSSDIQSLLNEGTFSTVYKKISTKRQETASKYQNSSAAAKSGFTPSERIITELAQDIIGETQQDKLLSQAAINTNIKSYTSITQPVIRQASSKYQNKSSFEEAGIKSPLNRLQQQTKNQLIFEDEEIYVPVSHQDYNEQKMQYRDEDSDFNVQYEDQDAQSAIGQSQMYSKKINTFENEPVINSSSSEDPREKLRSMMNQNERNTKAPNEASPLKSKYQSLNQKVVTTQNKTEEQQQQIQTSKIQANPQSLKQMVSQQHQQYMQLDQDMGGIATFSKPRQEVYYNQKGQSQKIQPITSQQNQSQREKTEGKNKPQRETDIATNPNFVADRVSKIFTDMSQKSIHFKDQSYDSSIQFNEELKHEDFLKRQQSQKKSSLANYPWLNDSAFDDAKQKGSQPPINQSQKNIQQRGLSNDQSQVIRNRTNNFLEGIKNEELPTPKKSNHLESRLISYLNDKEQFYRFEKFLSERKNFDVDYLHYFLKVMEFKKESNLPKAKLAAGMIIDKYLSEDAENYISMENHIVNQIIGDYEKGCLQSISFKEFDFKLFDLSTKNIEKTLLKYIDEFKQSQF